MLRTGAPALPLETPLEAEWVELPGVGAGALTGGAVMAAGVDVLVGAGALLGAGTILGAGRLAVARAVTAAVAGARLLTCAGARWLTGAACCGETRARAGAGAGRSRILGVAAILPTASRLALRPAASGSGRAEAPCAPAGVAERAVVAGALADGAVAQPIANARMKAVPTTVRATSSSRRAERAHWADRGRSLPELTSDPNSIFGAPFRMSACREIINYPRD